MNMTVGSHNFVKFTVIKPTAENTADVFLPVIKMLCTLLTLLLIAKYYWANIKHCDD